MKSFGSLMLGLSLTVAASGQVAAPQSLDTPATSQPVDPQQGKLFRSRISGIELYPPAGGTLIRQLNSGEIVRFAYTDRNWDIRVKPVPLHTPLKLTAPGDGGLLELTASQFTASNPTTEILRQEVITVNKNAVGVIEARYNAGTDRIFAQQAIFRDTDKRYFLLQMNSPGQAKNAAANAVDPEETQAKTAFTAMCNTVKVLDRSALRTEQDHRLLNTRQLWAQLDENKLLKTLQPLHFMRLVRDGKDVGFVQVNERPATHFGKSGFEIIIHSRVEAAVDLQPDAAKTTATSAAPGIVISAPLIPPKTSSGAPARPADQYTSSNYFVTFDRAHEDWSNISQNGERVTTQLTEMGNSDLADHIALNPAANQRRALTGPGQQPPVIEVPDYTLDVSRYASDGKPIGKPMDRRLMWFYLPQSLGQILPRVLPNDPLQYMFGFYVSGQGDVMGRYVDVEPIRDVVLDGQTVRAIPISDRIGVDGIPTTHYVTRAGEWLGSVNEESKLEVLPTDEKTLAATWPHFAVTPEPPLPTDAPAAIKPIPKNPQPVLHDPAEVQPLGVNGR